MKEKRFFTNWRIGLIVVFVVAVIAYLPALNGVAVWDDDDLLTGQAFGGRSLITAFTSPFLGHYFRPLTSVSFVLDSAYANQTPFFYHQTNILLHALTALSVALFAYGLTEKPLAGVLSGMFLALQPVQVGAAAWIGGRTDVLSCFFFSLCLASLAWHFRTQKYRWVILSALAFWLAAMTKEQALALFPAIPISIWAMGSRRIRDAFKIVAPFVAAVLAFIYFFILYSPPLRTSPFAFLSSAKLAVLTAADYGVALIFPTRASEMTYTVENFRSIGGLFLGITFISAFVWAVRRLWRQSRTIAWLLVAALMVYMPVSNFPPVPSFVVAPYRMALAGVVLASVFGIVGAYAVSGRKFAMAGALGLNLALGATVTWWSVHRWLTPESIFYSVSQTDRKFMVGTGNYAHVLNLAGKHKEALPYTDSLMTWLFGTSDWEILVLREKARAATPPVIERLATNSGIADPMLLGWFLGGHAATLAYLHRDKEAKLVAWEAIVFAPLDPKLNFSYGQLLVGNPETRKKALHYWRLALAMSPTYSACAIALGHERMKDGKYEEAAELLEPALERNPWNGKGWMDLADAKAEIGDFKGALAALERAKGGIFVRQADLDRHRAKILALEGKLRIAPNLRS